MPYLGETLSSRRFPTDPPFLPILRTGLLPCYLFYFYFCTLVTLVSNVALCYGAEVVAKETDVSALGWHLYRHRASHISHGCQCGADDATYQRAEVLIKIFRNQSHAWGDSLR